MLDLVEIVAMLNRGVLIVRPKQPYFDWAAEPDDSGILPSAEDEQAVHLMPSFEGDEDAESILREIYKDIFERELDGRHTKESAWPKTRTFAMFERWFHIESHSVVEDLCAYEIVDDDA